MFVLEKKLLRQLWTTYSSNLESHSIGLTALQDG